MGLFKKSVSLVLITCFSLTACESDPRKPARRVEKGLDLLENCGELLEDLDDLRNRRHDLNRSVYSLSGLSLGGNGGERSGGGLQNGGSGSYAISQGDRDLVCDAVATCAIEGHIDLRDLPEFDEECVAVY